MEAALWGGILLTAAWCNDTILMRSATSEHGEGRPMTDVRFAVDILQRFVVSPGAGGLPSHGDGRVAGFRCGFTSGRMVEFLEVRRLIRGN